MIYVYIGIHGKIECIGSLMINDIQGIVICFDVNVNIKVICDIFPD